MKIKNVEAIYPLTPLQEAMLLTECCAGTNGIGQMGCQLHGTLDADIFEEACLKAANRYTILRASFVWKRLDSPRQLIHKWIKPSLKRQDLRGLSIEVQEYEIRKFARSEREEGFNPAQAPLFSLALFRTFEGTHEFLCTYSRLLLDGFSATLFLQSILDAYDAMRAEMEFSIDAPCFCRDYIAWLKAVRSSEAESYWKEMFGSLEAPPPSISELARFEDSDEQAGVRKQQLQLSPSTASELTSLASEANMRTSVLIAGAWAILLNRYTGLRDVVFGARLSGRPTSPEGYERMLGPFSNTLPFRAHVLVQASALDWLKDFGYRLSELQQFTHNSSDQIKSWIGKPVNESIYETAVVLDDAPLNGLLDYASESLNVLNLHCVDSWDSPLTLRVADGKQLILEIDYDRSRFEDGMVERILSHLNTLLGRIANSPRESLSNIEILTDAESHRVLVEWNDTAIEHPRYESVGELFKAQVKLSPDATALAYEQERLSYWELDRRANQLANYLQKLGVAPEVKVCICAERSLEMVVGLLGILKAGGAFVPLDPTYPLERLAFMVEDVQSPFLLTQERLLDKLPDYWGQVICLDTDWDTIGCETDREPDSGLTPANLAYVIYTSGSTGKPKGALVNHAGFCNLIWAQRRTFDVRPDERVIQSASFSFDASIFEVFMALGAGATLLLPRQDSLTLGSELLDLLQRESITNFTVPPSSLATVPEHDLPALRTIVVAGEACPPYLVGRWSSNRRFFNAYGPTESTVWASVTECGQGTGRPSIGRPIDNTEIYLLSSCLQPVSVGMPGELHIGGIGLARGYLNRPDFTAERFIPNPFSKRGGERLYKSGDLARYLPDGNIDFIGRVDHQVKIRGFRIEPGEIEATLRGHPSLRDCAIDIREATPGDKRLLAFVVCDTQHPVKTNNLIEFLKKRLPEYMMPSGIVFLDALPLTHNGKLDRRALPDPTESRPELDVPFAPPRTQIEQMIASLWKDALKIEKVGLHDNFFDLGGHSLLMVQIHYQLQEKSNRDLSLLDMFRWPTVGSMASFLSSQDDAPPSVEEGHKLLERINEGKQRIKQRLNQRSRAGEKW